MKESLEMSLSILSTGHLDKSCCRTHESNFTGFQMEMFHHLWFVGSWLMLQQFCLYYTKREVDRGAQPVGGQKEWVNMLQRKTRWMTKAPCWCYKAKMLILTFCSREPEDGWKRARSQKMTPEENRETVWAVSLSYKDCIQACGYMMVNMRDKPEF